MWATRNEGSDSNLTQWLRGQCNIVSQQSSTKQEETEREWKYIPALRHVPAGLTVRAPWQKLLFSHIGPILLTTEIHSVAYAHIDPGVCVGEDRFKTNQVHQMAHINSGDTQAIIPTFKTRWYVAHQHPETRERKTRLRTRAVRIAS